MAKRTYTIGQVSKLTGVPIRRLRFYEDIGVVREAERTGSGYRLFNDEDLVRIGLVKSLREAGLSLQSIKNLSAQNLSLKDLLTLRLDEIEAAIAAQRRVANAIKTVLSSQVVDDDQLRRIWMMNSLSNADRANIVAEFFERVTRGSGVDRAWAEWMNRMSAPKLPEQPTEEQINAWIELSTLIESPAFLQLMRQNGADTSGPLNAEIFDPVGEAIEIRVKAALAQKCAPESAIGLEIAEHFLSGWAEATENSYDNVYLEKMARKHLRYRPQLQRYWQLVAILGGLPGKSEPTNPEGFWLNAAICHRLSSVELPQ